MMPAVAAATAALYDRLPEHYRDADEGLDYPLLRYLSTLLDQLEPLEAIADRIDYDADTPGDTSDLVDATTANAGWLPWLAQLLGVRLEGLTIAEQRAALADPSTSWAHGTPDALAAAAAKGLTGTRAVTITPHYAGDPFTIGLGTLDSETGSPTTFAALKAVAPTWGDLEALGSFVPKPAALATAEAERPSGYQLVRYSTGA